jgi:MFS family permease
MGQALTPRAAEEAVRRAKAHGIGVPALSRRRRSTAVPCHSGPGLILSWPQLPYGPMSPTTHLAAINLFTGDIQGGLGPFLATWLAQSDHWSPRAIGSVSTIVGLATLLLNAPAGALVDHWGRPRLCLGLACAAILAGTALIVPAQGVAGVAAAEFLAAAGGTLLPPALTSLTLGIVGKDAFPRQQGRNQAFNHAGILGAALLISQGTRWLGPEAAFWVLGGMSAASLATVATTPGDAWNGRRAHGWSEDEPDEAQHRGTLRDVLGNRRLLLLAFALALFNIGNGFMLALLGQRMVALGQDATGWTATYVMVAQGVMIPVALWAGSRADRRGRRHLLLLACASLPVRAALSAWLTDPLWLIPAEMLDGFGSSLLGVAVPVLVADLTWGSGRTQTALGTVNTLQGVGGALAGVIGGVLAQRFGWTGAFLALAVPAGAAFGLAWWLEETRPEPKRG